MNELRDSLSRINATEEIKSDTIKYLLDERNKREAKRKSPNIRYICVICAVSVCMMFIIGIGGYSIYQMPVCYISIDVNPSIELKINRWNQVIDVKAYNDDAQNLITDINLKNMQYIKAINKLLNNEQYRAYLQNNQTLVFTVISDNFKKIFTEIESCEGYKKYNAYTQVSDSVCMNEAHQHEMSFGKYTTYLELSQYDESITIEDCHKMTMGELCDRISSCHENSQPIDSSSSGKHGEHQGNQRRHHKGHH